MLEVYGIWQDVVNIFVFAQFVYSSYNVKITDLIGLL